MKKLFVVLAISVIACVDEQPTPKSQIEELATARPQSLAMAESPPEVPVQFEPANFMTDVGSRATILVRLDNVPRSIGDPVIESVVDALTIVNLETGVGVDITAVHTNAMSASSTEDERRSWRGPNIIAVTPTSDLADAWHLVTLAEELPGIAEKSSGGNYPGRVRSHFPPISAKHAISRWTLTIAKPRLRLASAGGQVLARLQVQLGDPLLVARDRREHALDEERVFGEVLSDVLHEPL